MENYKVLETIGQGKFLVRRSDSLALALGLLMKLKILTRFVRKGSKGTAHTQRARNGLESH